LRPVAFPVEQYISDVFASLADLDKSQVDERTVQPFPRGRIISSDVVMGDTSKLATDGQTQHTTGNFAVRVVYWLVRYSTQTISSSSVPTTPSWTPMRTENLQDTREKLKSQNHYVWCVSSQSLDAAWFPSGVELTFA
jgi:hypothetical protein